MTAAALLVAVVLLAANAFFTAVEFALVAASRSRLEVLAESGNRRARVAVRAMGDLGMQLAGAQLGLTMTALGLGFVVEPAVARLLDPLLGGFGHAASVAVAIAIVVFAHVPTGRDGSEERRALQPRRSGDVAGPGAPPVRRGVPAGYPCARMAGGCAGSSLRRCARRPGFQRSHACGNSRIFWRARAPRVC